MENVIHMFLDVMLNNESRFGAIFKEKILLFDPITHTPVMSARFTVEKCMMTLRCHHFETMIDSFCK